MAAKITITGLVEKIRRLTPDEKTVWMCLEIVTGGSPSAPKGLPMASKDVQHTVVLNNKQYTKLESEAKSVGMNVKGSKVLIQGEITLDLSYEVQEGDIGVIAFQAECLEATKALREVAAAAEPEVNDIKPIASEALVSAPIPALSEGNEVQNQAKPKCPDRLDLEQIVIPQGFQATTPNEKKIETAIQYFVENSRFDKLIKVYWHNGWILADGYVRYIAAQRLNLKDVEVSPK